MKAVIVGACQFEKIDLVKEFDDADVFLAADGGYAFFEENGITPDIFVGDKDTYLKDAEIKAKEVIILNRKKDDTDVFYAVKLLIKRGIDEFHLFGCLGGKIDHTIANIQLLSYLVNHNCRGYLYSQDNQTVVHMIKNSCIRLTCEKDSTYSVFSYNSRVRGVNEKGGEYELNDVELSNTTPLGISNRFKGEQVTISVKDGELLLTYPRSAKIYE